MDYSTKTTKDRLREKEDWERKSCLQFILFFILMIICMILITWSLQGTDY